MPTELPQQEDRVIQPDQSTLQQPQGMYQANQEDITQQNKQEERDKLRTMARAADEVVATLSAVFPFQLFPDQIIVTKEKVDIVYSYFFFSKQVFTILLTELNTVEVESNPFFGAMRFEVQGYEKNPSEIHFLPKAEAFELQSTIIGLMAAKKRGVGVEPIPEKELHRNVQRIGKVRTDLQSI